MSPDEISKLSGLDVLTAISDGRIDHPSMAHTLGFRLTEVEEGLAVIEGHDAAPVDAPGNLVLVLASGYTAVALDAALGVTKEFHTCHDRVS